MTCTALTGGGTGADYRIGPPHKTQPATVAQNIDSRSEFGEVFSQYRTPAGERGYGEVNQAPPTLIAEVTLKG